MNDYEKAVQLALTNKHRWEEGIEHHPLSQRLMSFIAAHDFHDYDDHFCWKLGGDGDNGECLMYEMDAFFELVDMIPRPDAEEARKAVDTLLAEVMWMYEYKHNGHDDLVESQQDKVLDARAAVLKLMGVEVGP